MTDSATSAPIVSESVGVGSAGTTPNLTIGFAEARLIVYGPSIVAAAGDAVTPKTKTLFFMWTTTILMGVLEGFYVGGVTVLLVWSVIALLLCGAWLIT